MIHSDSLPELAQGKWRLLDGVDQRMPNLHQHLPSEAALLQHEINHVQNTIFHLNDSHEINHVQNTILPAKILRKSNILQEQQLC